MSTACTTSDSDRAELLQYMRPEEDLREHRRFRPWDGEFRLFRSVNVAKLEDYRPAGEMSVILSRMRRQQSERRAVGHR